MPSLLEFHTTEVCPEFQQPWAQWPPEYAMGMLPPRFYSPGPQQEPCRKFNENRSFLRWCRYLRICSICGQPHPASFCAESPTRMRFPRQARDRSPRQQHHWSLLKCGCVGLTPPFYHPIHYARTSIANPVLNWVRATCAWSHPKWVEHIPVDYPTLSSA